MYKVTFRPFMFPEHLLQIEFELQIVEILVELQEVNEVWEQVTLAPTAIVELRDKQQLFETPRIDKT